MTSGMGAAIAVPVGQAEVAGGGPLPREPEHAAARAFRNPTRDRLPGDPAPGLLQEDGRHQEGQCEREHDHRTSLGLWAWD